MRKATQGNSAQRFGIVRFGDYLEFLGDDSQVDVIQIADESSDNYLLLEVG